MKIVIAEPLGVDINLLESLKIYFKTKGHYLRYYPDRNENPKEIIKRTADADILTVSNIPISKEIIDACPNLKLINVAFTGYDHIDIEACKERNIMVCNAAGYSTTAVSELSIGLAISLLRNTIKLEANTRIPEDRNNYLGVELSGKKVGIIGTGSIGLATAKLFHAFGCEILAYSRTKKDIDFINYVSLDKLITNSDIISLHIPANDATKNIINKEKLNLMKSSAVLINTARGQVLDSQALANALKSNKIAGAAIDIYEQEPPLPKNHPLLDTPNTILMPHIAYATKEAMIKRLGIVKTNIESFINGELENRIV
ncbi:MAG: NAD(P)-dependent oxidoreductase [Bacteroidales bacterium]|nr:NAD(P)-dependent oxidoreductase [Bacteroidales bacterium]